MKQVFDDEYVDKITASVEGRTFTLHGSDGSEKELVCDTADQFTTLFKMIQENMEKLPNGFEFQ
jgi:hypothetical protein